MYPSRWGFRAFKSQAKTSGKKRPAFLAVLEKVAKEFPNGKPWVQSVAQGKLSAKHGYFLEHMKLKA